LHRLSAHLPLQSQYISISLIVVVRLPDAAATAAPVKLILFVILLHSKSIRPL